MRNFLFLCSAIFKRRKRNVIDGGDKEKRDQVNSHTINPLKEKMVAVNKSR